VKSDVDENNQVSVPVHHAQMILLEAPEQKWPNSGTVDDGILVSRFDPSASRDDITRFGPSPVQTENATCTNTCEPCSKAQLEKTARARVGKIWPIDERIDIPHYE
jgi:hypothetical protein